MKQYLVNEEDIYDLIYDVETNNEHIEKAKNFLKFKTPVEEIEILDASLVGSINYPREDSKQIKIYIQEVQK